MEIDKIIELIGGYKALSEILNVSKSAISNYKKRVKFYKLSEFKVNCENKNKNEIINQISKIIENESSEN